jgi:hypothetical protein
MPPALAPFVNPIAPVRASRDDNDQPSTAPRHTLLLTIADRFAPRNIHILLLLVIAVRTLAAGLLSPQTIFRGEQCTTGAVLAPTTAGRE